MKRILQRIIAVAMVVCMIPTMVFAGEQTGEKKTHGNSVVKEDKHDFRPDNKGGNADEKDKGSFSLEDLDMKDYEEIARGLFELLDKFGGDEEEAKDSTQKNTSASNAGGQLFSMEDDGYELEQVVILSRHNLRAPLSSSGSVPQELTPNEWIDWTAPASELTVKGGIEETNMGQFFRKWLEKEGLISENAVPKAGEVRFNARDKQRCRATARYFSSGLFPLADINVEYPGDAAKTQDFMEPMPHFYSKEYAEAVRDQVAEMGGKAGFDGISDETRDAIKLIMDVVDMKDSEAYKSGKYGDLLKDKSDYEMVPDKEPDVTGAIKTASQVADALVLQYYEEMDDDIADFGHGITQEDWNTIGGFMTKYLTLRHGAPLLAVNVTNPLIKELESELKNKNRKLTFFCAHDCTVLGTLSALGAKPYELPDSIETKTPIGVKLMFERLKDKSDKVWYRVSLVYRSADQIRYSETLTPDNPPYQYILSFDGVKTNKEGLIAEDDLFAMFDKTLDAYDELEEEYSLKKAA